MTIDEIRRVIREELGKGEGVAAEFKEICAIETGDSGEPIDYDSMHPMAMSCEADDLEKFFGVARDERKLQKHAGVAYSGWDEQVSAPRSKVEKRHADGIEIEKHGNQTWHWHWQGGELVKSMVEDPDLPGGVMHFDRDGNEIEIAA